MEPREKLIFLQILLSKTAHVLMLPELSSVTFTVLFLEQKGEG